MAGATGSVAVMEPGVMGATEAATAAGEVAIDSPQARLALQYVDALRLAKPCVIRTTMDYCACARSLPGTRLLLYSRFIILPLLPSFI